MATRTPRRRIDFVQRTPKILMLSPVMPDGLGSGLEKRCAIFLDALERAGDVDLCILPLSKPNLAAQARIKARQRITLLPHLLDHQPDTHFALMSRLRSQDDWLSAFATYGRPSLSAMLSASLLEALADRLKDKRYDLIHASRSYVGPFALDLVRRLNGPPPKLSLDLDEDDALAFAMQARMFPLGSFEARKAALEARAFGRLITATALQFNLIWASSNTECAGLNRRYSIASQPVSNAVDIATPIARNPSSRRLLFVGSMEHPFNVDAAQILINQVWPRLRGLGVHLDIVGKSPPADLIRLASQPGIKIHGWVNDLRPLYQSAAALIAPLRFGAGTRFKLAEAAAHGVPIIATSMAAEGLGFRNHRDLWLADTPKGIASATRDLLAHPYEAARRAQNARKTVARNLNRPRIVSDLAQQITTMLDFPPRA